MFDRNKNSNKDSNKARCKKAKDELYNRLDIAEEEENELSVIKPKVVDDTELLEEHNYITEDDEYTKQTYEDIIGLKRHIGIAILYLAIAIGLIITLSILFSNR